MENTICVEKLFEYWKLSEPEYQLTISRFVKDGYITNMPSKYQKKVYILIYIYTLFSFNIIYDEQEVNAIIKKVYSDYATIRRDLVDFGLLIRDKGGRCYEKNK